MTGNNNLYLHALLGIVKLRRHNRSDDMDLLRNKKSQFQNNVLKKIFNLTMYPTNETKANLGILLDLSVKTIQIWFQNERRNKKSEVHNRSNEKLEISIEEIWNVYMETKGL